MSLRGYKKKGKTALWLSVAGAHPVKSNSCEPKARPSVVRNLKASIAWVKLSRRLVAEANERGERCPVLRNVPGLGAQFFYGYPLSAKINQCHHWAGRGHGGRGPLLLDDRLIIPVSMQGHRWIDSHRDEARKFGWLAPVGKYNVPVPPDAVVTRNEWGGIVVEPLKTKGETGVENK